MVVAPRRALRKREVKPRRLQFKSSPSNNPGADPEQRLARSSASSWGRPATGRRCAPPPRFSPSSALPTRRASSLRTACPTTCSPMPKRAVARGLQAIIAGAGGAAHLPGMLAAKTIVPVLGVPVASRHLHGRRFAATRSSRCRAAFRSPPSPSARPAPPTRPCSRWRCSPAATTRCARRLEAFRARQTEAARAMIGRAEVNEPAAAAPAFIAPGATLGVLGGGQLGRMFVHAAQTHAAIDTLVLDPDRRARPAGRAAAHRAPAISTPSARCAALAGAMRSGHHRVRERAGRRRSPRWPQDTRWRRARRGLDLPGPRAREGALRRDCGVPCAPHAVIEPAAADLAAVDDDAAARHPQDGAPRLRRQGPGDGRRPRRAGRRVRASCGSVRLRAREAPGAGVRAQRHRRARRRRRAWSTCRCSRTCIATASSRVTRVPARGRRGVACSARQSRARASHRRVDRTTSACCASSSSSSPTARWSPTRWRRGPHNSGHYSIDACDLSQFELQVRTLDRRAAGDAAPAFAGRDAQPARRPLARGGGAGASPTGARCSPAGRAPAPVRQGRRAGPAARWATSPSPPPTRRRARERAGRVRPPRCWGCEGLLMRAARRHSTPTRSLSAPRAGSPPASSSRFRPRRSTASARAPTTTPPSRDLRRQGPAGRPSADRACGRARPAPRAFASDAAARGPRWSTPSGPAR